MTKNGNCINFHIVLTALSPVHIGSGQEVLKKNFLFDSKSGTVTFYDMDKLFGLIAKYGKIDQYERYMLSGDDRMERFISSCELTRNDFREAELYSVQTAGVFDSEHTLTSIRKFVRLADSRPYIPGSSLKGALRTVVLHSLIREGQYTERNLKDKRGKYTSEPVEHELLDTLDLGDKNVSPQCQSVMRGLMISDSEPISNSDIILAKKLDEFVYDSDSSQNRINTIRECVRPGTKLRFAVTIDTSLINMTSEKLLGLIRNWFGTYEDSYLSRFDKGESTLPDNNGCCIVIGGGSGYFSKNITYSALGHKPAVSWLQGYFTAQKKLKTHKHEYDIEDDISPHMLKCTEYIGRLVQFGICGVEVE